LNRAVFLLSLAAFASAASLRATDPLLPLIADEYGVTAGAASAAVTAFALSYGLLQVVCGPLGDRYGRYRTIAAAAFVSAFGSAACALAPSLAALVAARFVSGATIGAFIPLALAWIGDTVAYEKRQPLLARFLVGQMAGVAFGTADCGLARRAFRLAHDFLRDGGAPSPRRAASSCGGEAQSARRAARRGARRDP
jgi:YNFM family putative membrane transporter